MKKYILTIILIVGVLGGAFYLYGINLQSKNSLVSNPIVPLEVSGREIPKGYMEYINEKYNISLLYPKGLIATEVFQNGEAVVITFENVKDKIGFQIFVVPYNNSQITPERFKMDMPSGVQKDLVDITIDGVLGASFYGFDEVLGDTKEIWFIKDGLLYEVSTVKGLESWLGGVMDSWRFLKNK